MTPRVRLKRWGTPTRLPLPATLHHPQTQDGLVQPPERPPSPLLRVTSLVDRQALVHQDSSHFPLVLEHQGNIQGLHQHLVASHLVLAYLDNTLHQELQGSSPLAQELLGNSLGSFPLKEPQDSCPEAQFLTQLDHFPPALELLLGLIQTCLSQEVNQVEVMKCTDQVVSPHQLALDLSLLSLVEHFPLYPLAHGAPRQVGASLQPLALLLLVLDQWVHMMLQEACW